MEEVFVLTLNVSGVNVVNVYKLPKTLWNNPPLRVLDHQTMYIGDFNSHSLHWSYDDDDDNGLMLFDWLFTINVELVYSAKDKKDFPLSKMGQGLFTGLGNCLESVSKLSHYVQPNSTE